MNGDFSKFTSQELVDAVRQNSQEAAEELVSRFERGVRYVLRKEAFSLNHLEDLFQDSFCVALEQLREGKLNDTNSLGSFIYGVAKFIAWESNRKNQRNQAYSSELTFEPKHEEDPFQKLEKHEAARLVRSVIEQLPNSRDRQVIYRVYLEEQDRAEICKELSLTLGQLNLILHRARDRYRDLYLEAVARVR